MKEHGIIFSGPTVRDFIEKRKYRKKIYAPKGCEEDYLYLVQRLSNGLDSAEEGRCWEWKRSKNLYGYGTITIRSDNMIDSVRKGRLHPPIVKFLGELNPMAKLKTKDVETIRILLSHGEIQYKIAALFGVSSSQIGNIKKGFSWR